MEIKEAKRDFSLLKYAYTPRARIVLGGGCLLILILILISLFSFMNGSLPYYFIEIFGLLILILSLAFMVGYRKRKYTLHVLENTGIRSKSVFPFMRESFTYYRDFTKIGLYKEYPLSGRLVFTTNYLTHYSKGIGVTPAVEFYFDTFDEYIKFRDFIKSKNCRIIEVILDVTNPTHKLNVDDMYEIMKKM